ncbi:MAG: DUF4215 domain-containing protein [Myxococcota bacterium]
MPNPNALMTPRPSARLVLVQAAAVALASALAIAAGPAAHADPEPPHEAWHFLSDPTRHARVDDRGGLGEGFSFSVGYDPEDGNSEDFCPHCRLTIVTSDPGLDLSLLEKLGVQRKDISSTAGLLSTIQGIVSKDPTGLAKELAPALSDADLAAYAVEIAFEIDQLTDVLTALTTLSSLDAGGFDWSALAGQNGGNEALDALIETLALKQDSAFMAHFSDPNDPRVHNSGVAVFSLADLLSGLANKGVPAGAQQALKSAISAIPGLSGPLELSGDDDDVTAPVTYHGYHTDLSVQQRTYVVDGVSAYLVTFTVVNDTTRLIPLVDVAMIADFDIPPLGYDDHTEYDPTTHMVSTYDAIPYTDPEENYGFGFAPAGFAPLPTPGTFSFKAYNRDKNLTLAQSAQSIHENRFRFFLGDPSIVGNHDDAIGKSEKEGAVALHLDGPLFPGDSRSFAFCFAAGEGGSPAAAKTELGLVMTACQSLYTALNPHCGDGVLGYGEDCEPTLSAPGKCSLDCKDIKCGDERVAGDEQCDDGNTDDGDGCSSSCVSEVCGNGIVQAGEACDDGNASNDDGCLTTCQVPHCGDGFVKACTGLGCTGCAGHAICWQGTFTLSTYGLTNTANSAFGALKNAPVSYLFAFDVASTDANTAAGNLSVTTGPIHAELSASGAAGAAAVALAEGSVRHPGPIKLRGAPGTAPPLLVEQKTGIVVEQQRTIFEVDAQNGGVSWDTDIADRPRLDSVHLTNATVRFTKTSVVIGPSQDTADGPISGQFAPVPADAGGEACDDGNLSDYDDCTSACVAAVCGDGFIQPSAGEECDGGASPPAWCVGCKLANIDLCGNGTVEDALGEECDDHDTDDGDGCSSTCRVEKCGDGIVQAPEECDDGKNGDGDGCTDQCKRERCGDGVVQDGEACDAGAQNADTAACTTACKAAACGDGFLQSGVEGCDDGNSDEGDGCDPDCVVETCGDGAPGPDEECDDGNDQDGDGCRSDCVIEFCGDGLPGPGEQCDDKNALDGDGCSKDCQLENPAACGDGKRSAGEQCDDGGSDDGDGCDAHCQLEDPAKCGDGQVDPGEQCDDGNDRDGDGCTALCATERCGDGFQQAGEGCDDGDNDDGDGCDAECQLEPTECGNGVQELGEQCDDGNDDDGDTCAGCVLVGKAPLAETCGNGQQDVGEQCDDGNRMEGDGCGETCQREAAVCGNGRIELGETCDDQNGDAEDGCDQCKFTPPTPPYLAPTGCSKYCAGAPSNALPLEWLALGWVLVRLMRLTRRRRA